jgi:hypothetical protein
MNVPTGLARRTLACHPRTPSRTIRAIGVTAEGRTGGGVALRFALEGDLTVVRIPGRRPSRRVDGLWRHTCFEAFVMTGQGPGYREFNFSPSGEWAVMAFHGYRDGGEPVAVRGPEIAVRRDGERLELAAEISPACLPPGSSLRLGLSAVVEDVHGELTYWALRHPPGQPDFHHKDAFVVLLDLPVMPGIDAPAGGGMK